MKVLSKLLPALLIISLLLGLVAWSGGALASTPSQPGSQDDSQRYIIKFKSGVTTARMTQLHKSAGGEFESSIPELGIQVVRIPRNAISARLLAYRGLGEVDYIEQDSIATAIETPNDTSFGTQWGMTVIKAPEAWDITHGSNAIRIAILDTGIDAEHIDLASKVVAVRNFSSSATADDVHGHGSHVAGIAAALTNNGIGVAGVGYDTSLMNVKVLGDTGSGYYSAIAQGIIWAADNGANIINMSLGGGSGSLTLQQAVDYAWNKGVVVVAAAGNNGSSTPSYPAYYSNVIAVAASNSSDKLYYFSNYGSWVDVAAPGSALSTYPNNSYVTMSGTSMASPFVAGLAGLVSAVTTDTNGNGRINDEVRSRIESNTDAISTAIAHGRINAQKALNGVPAPPPTTTGGITGTVRAANTSLPISGATVTDGTRSATTDSSGVYSISNIPAGVYNLTASASGYQTSAAQATVTGGQMLTINFALSPNPAVNHPPILAPIGNKTAIVSASLAFTVTASDPDNDALTFTATGLPSGATFNNAHFNWTPTAVGSYQIHFAVSDGKGGVDAEDITVTVLAAPAATMWIDSITFTPSGSYLYINVKVVSPQPVIGARVTVKVQMGSYTVSAAKTTGTDGKVTFRLYPAIVGTTYKVTVTGLTCPGYTWDATKGTNSATYTYTNGSPPPSPTSTPSPSPTDEQIQNEAFNLVNNARTAAGLAPLINDPNLVTLARGHVQYMIQQGVISHDGFYDRAARSGYSYVGENVAQGFRSAQTLVNAWLSSSGHRANIMNPSFRYAGLAYINGWACMIFGG